MFQRSIPALITPFTKDNLIDEDSFVDHIEWQISEGSSGLVPAGTTGESSTLSYEEHCRVVELCVKTAAGRVPVMAGAGSNNTKESIELAQYAQNTGADALLVVVPYYNKPNKKGLLAHFGSIANAVSLPIYIYNNPSRTVIEMDVDTMAELVKTYSNIVGVKDATGRIELASGQRIACGSDFIQLSGDDSSALGFNVHGGVGCISVTANVAPRICAEFQKAISEGDYRQALEYQDKLFPLHQALFIEPSISSVKYALSRLGRNVSLVVRAPMVSILEKETMFAIDQALDHIGLCAG
ncbi:4-hydroxy-tetrahydrodipicolinate synthase [Candidatus Liberibacter solanacearum]|uniref:4-hydroxy-tetrahydrodipicolinate synthase n=2 Tax=Candidatus Liberibacter solanacearum TaxID=556287 RepID=A0A0F4VK59_9HYPH|nr:4-hydroxy-tetrahydrodipicolinate synthase [Candidatus Liberibacter solanacearum]7MJF_A Chain A, 4-hydroxy-tetrahydrodipicolinate synthase [Candidatus Liberibacter solanacearum]7MJF_B Chain B, 4-hydroxy-tetrahydrodipicolinate synthase [Candidatus Liberibacter solanacearum]7MJF_C Chain C, 4-hydroxy-tetrahydrodipicolinate synthase [Candidatus Liberibacter solanacearum]7MJF_D Chain D, 4-hydroxy-tetrahydrodipicolinate synthase [Candidatus Liberibacter solanacearum]7MJF_E Chain E, 4-hydroxy-tetra